MIFTRKSDGALFSEEAYLNSVRSGRHRSDDFYTEVPPEVAPQIVQQIVPEVLAAVISEVPLEVTPQMVAEGVEETVTDPIVIDSPDAVVTSAPKPKFPFKKKKNK